MSSQKIPPHSLEAEQAVLASAIIDANVIDELLGTLNAEDFYQSAHRCIYEALINLNTAGKPLDLVTLITRLTDEGTLEKAGGLEYVSELVRIIPNAANVEAYSRVIGEKALLRQMISAGASISELGYNVAEPVEDLIDSAQAIAYGLGADRSRSDAKHIKTVANDVYDNLAKRFDNRSSNDDGEVSGVPSGFPDLDKITNGFQRSDLIVVGARPGMGKTSFGLNVLYNAAVAGHAGIFFSLEMSSEQLVNRLISSECKIGSDALRTGRFNSDDWIKLGEFTSKLERLEIYLDDTPSITVNQVRAKCRKLMAKLKGRLDIIFIDYLQIMGVNKSLSVREQQISEISRSLKALAKELNIPVIAFAQLNRGIEARADNRPVLSDLRESGAIEQDADIVMFLYREKDDPAYQNVAELLIRKHRNGRTGDVFLHFEPNFTRFDRRALDMASLPPKRDTKQSRKRKEDKEA